MIDQNVKGPWTKFKLIFGNRRNHENIDIDMPKKKKLKVLDDVSVQHHEILNGVLEDQYVVLDFAAF
jgi:hypothetical protein